MIQKIAELATSMLVTDDGDEMCWRQLSDVTNIEILSLTFKNCHQDKVTKIHLSATSM